MEQILGSLLVEVRADQEKLEANKEMLETI
jgi:hypothetical protein